MHHTAVTQGVEGRLHNIETWLRDVDGKVDRILQDHSQVEKITRLEAEVGFLRKIVYGAIGILVTVELVGAGYLIQHAISRAG